jgi:thiopurine S-methyltransferase
MNRFDKEYWTIRYKNSETGWDIGAASPPLKDYIDQLTDKSIAILIPGAGNAHEAEYLFNKGFKNVTVIDIAREPLENIEKRIPNFPKKQLLETDFFEHKRQYDLILEQTFLCAVNPLLKNKYIEKMVELMKPKGKLVGVIFTEPVNAKIPPFGASKEEYKKLFEEKFILKVFTNCYNSIKPSAGRELFIHLIKKEL